jgi:hypothetical protein
VQRERQRRDAVDQCGARAAGDPRIRHDAVAPPEPGDADGEARGSEQREEPTAREDAGTTIEASIDSRPTRRSRLRSASKRAARSARSVFSGWLKSVSQLSHSVPGFSLPQRAHMRSPQREHSRERRTLPPSAIPVTNAAASAAPATRSDAPRKPGARRARSAPPSTSPPPPCSTRCQSSRVPSGSATTTLSL